MKTIKLFLGDDYYPSGGYSDFEKCFDNLIDAKNYVEFTYTPNECGDKWAHMVQDDEIVFSGWLKEYGSNGWIWDRDL